jgi:N-acetylglucosamine-6-phosphate deacetylase
MADIPSRFSGPGLVDLQVNGYAGFDFNSDPDSWTAEDFSRVRNSLRKRGVIAALPTIITDDVDQMLKRVSKYSTLIESNPGLASQFPGIHIEGPFISPNDGPRGAHPNSHCRHPAELPRFLEDMRQESGGRISLITLAPELKGTIELIEEATNANICVGIGHTEAGFETINEAVRAGVKISTHLGNGSHQLLHRHANYIQMQLAMDELFASFIADGHHVPFYALKNFIRAKGMERSILVTDAMSAAEMGPGRYSLGNERVVVRDDLYVSIPGQKNLAGSALTLDRAILNVAANCDVPFESAWQMASVRPASLIGLKELPEITVEIGDHSFTLK